ncbi:MAG: DUF4115 domain-containing protein [Nitrospirae bacterium]|nr:DUF4115 domain-containing protein [Nitrospirota bacterium]
MGELKEFLKSARDKKGLSLRDISNRTRISYTFLEAIEEENFSVIPGEVFVTGFLRTYARELGLDEKEAVAIYKKLNAQSQEAVEQQGAAPAAALAAGGSASSPTKVSLVHVIIAGLVLGAVLIAVMLLVTKEDAPETAAVPPPPQAAMPAAPAFASPTSAIGGTAVLGNATSAPVPEQPPAATAPLVLKLDAVEDSWYSYRVDGGDRMDGSLKKGDSLDVEAEEKIVLSLGNAGGVRLDFNGKPAGPFGPKGAVRKGILFTKDVPGKILTQKQER